MNYISRRDFYWIVPLSLALGAVMSSLQPGNWVIGWLGFSFLFLLSFTLLTFSTKWADGGKALAWMVVLAFSLRFIGGVTSYFALPIYGYGDDEDQGAGFTYTDAHRRDAQAWELADSDRPILDAFNENFAYDQYGGLLAFSALIYRYLSPDAHRVLMLVLVSGFMGALGLPFLWKAVKLQWGGKLALASGWIFALYPESVLLGGSAMREPYLMAFSAFTLWGFVQFGMKESVNSKLPDSIWLGSGMLGMLLVSPSIALMTLVILGGWLYFSNDRRRISWWMIAAAIVIFTAGLFILSAALNRQGNLDASTPIGIINNFVREAVKWDVYQLERGSGWVQKLFDEMPEWMRMPFVMVYGILQPVLPAIFVVPTTPYWRVIGIARALGWYTMLPALILSFVASLSSSQEKSRKFFIWLSIVIWFWVLFTALRGGGDQWDNPRYRTILFLWQAILAGNVWVWWRETKSAWFGRVIAMEVALVAVFGEWYLNRYLHIGVQISFANMIVIIAGLWGGILAWGFWQDRKQAGAGV